MTDDHGVPGATPGAVAPTGTRSSAPSPADLPLAAVQRAERRSRAQGPWNVDHLKICWTVLLGVGVVIGIVAALVVGGRAVFGVIVGTLIVGLFFTVSAVVIAAVGLRHPSAVTKAAVAAYLVKIVILGVVLVLVPRIEAINTRWMAIAVMAGLFAWMGTHLRYVWTARIFYVDPKA
jgi:ATP synthase protein I